MLSQWITIAGAAIVLASSLKALNGMTVRGCNVQRVAHVLLSAGAMGLIAQPVFGGLDSRWPVASLVMGTALCSIAKHRAIRVSAKAFDAWRKTRAGARL